MKIVFSFLSVVLALISAIVFGLYSYETLLSIVFSALFLIDLREKRLPFSISYLVESAAFCTVIILGMEEVSRPVLQQSIILPILILAFLAMHIGFTIFGLYIVARKKESLVHLWDIIPFILAFVLFAFFLILRSNLAHIASFILILFCMGYQTLKNIRDLKPGKNG